jgi:hypothetical protein
MRRGVVGRERGEARGAAGGWGAVDHTRCGVGGDDSECRVGISGGDRGIGDDESIHNCGGTELEWVIQV